MSHRNNGKAPIGKFCVQLRLSDEDRQRVDALCTILGISSTEFCSRAVRNEVKAVDGAPTIKAAMDAILGAREHIKRSAAARKAGA